jgi:hypothetical protein
VLMLNEDDFICVEPYGGEAVFYSANYTHRYPPTLAAPPTAPSPVGGAQQKTAPVCMTVLFCYPNHCDTINPTANLQKII